MEVSITLYTTKAYADDLKKRMKRLGVSQNQLAEMLGKSPTQVSRWFTANEARRVQPTLPTVMEIEEALKKVEKRQGANGSAAMNK